MVNTETSFLGLVQEKGKIKRSAFTMIELVFVIVIVGILSIMIASSFGGNNLRQAADQVVSHIRYTQHLAMMDNKFDINDPTWFKERWQIRFKQDIDNTSTNCNGEDSNNAWTYMIYTNKFFHTNNNPNNNEIAKNPLNSNELLSGGYNNLLCQNNAYNLSDEQSMEKMRLGDEYGVENIIFSGGCDSTVGANKILYLNFDYLGRPFNMFPTNTPYQVGTSSQHRLLISDCKIVLLDADKNITIVIKPETGYTYIEK